MLVVFFFKQKTAYEMRISDWSSDVCSSDLVEGGKVLAPTIEFLTQRGIPVMGHVGLTPQAVNILGGYGVRGKSAEEARSIVEDAVAVAQAGAFSIVIEGVLESIAIEIKNGRAHVRTPVTNAQLVCRLLLEKKKKNKN